jgi:hypothetical protein
MTTLITEELTEKTPATAKKKAGVAKRRAHVAAAKAKPPRKAHPSKKADGAPRQQDRQDPRPAETARRRDIKGTDESYGLAGA